MKYARNFWGRKKERYFWVAEKGLRDFRGGYAKKSSDFFGLTNSEVVIFLGIKYKPLSDPSPPSLKFMSGIPGTTLVNR